ncbi:hypothetical protein L7F22_007530 [Adiantum nelumboides]|nr:hypothetical protein [Adiantum nelumboides]
MFQRFGMGDKTSILEYLGEDVKKWASMEFSLERRTGEQWYNAPTTILGQLVWKTSFENTVKLAKTSIDRHSMGLEEYAAKCEKARGVVEQTFRDRAYKMLTIANPSNGNSFFQLIFNYDWSKKAMVALTKEKLYILATSRIHTERKTEVLHMLMSGKVKDEATIDMFGDNKKTLLHMQKELYWEELMEEGESIIEGLAMYDDVPTYGFGKWVKNQREMNVRWAFHEVWKDLAKVKEGGKQHGIEEASKRVVYRWIQQLIGEGVMDDEGETMKDWENVDSKDTMYPKAWVERGVSQWELTRCPWWLDYPLGRVPPCEEGLWKVFEGIGTRSESQRDLPLHETSSLPSPEPNINQSTIASTSHQNAASTSSQLVRERRTKRRLDHVQEDQGKQHHQQERMEKSNVEYLSQMLVVDICTLSEGSHIVESFLKKIQAPLSYIGAPSNTVAHLVWADFPTGLRVADVETDECPPWNSISTSLVCATLCFAGLFMADEGLFVCLSLMEHLPKIHKMARKVGLVLHRTMSLHVESSYLYENGKHVGTLALTMFYQEKCNLPIIDREAGEEVFQGSKKFYYGEQQKASFFTWLVKTFSDEGDAIVDIFAGCGGLGRAVQELKRNYLGIENDAELARACLADFA